MKMKEVLGATVPAVVRGRTVGTVQLAMPDGTTKTLEELNIGLRDRRNGVSIRSGI
jgi:hypothetical protein